MQHRCMTLGPILTRGGRVLFLPPRTTTAAAAATCWLQAHWATTRGCWDGRIKWNPSDKCFGRATFGVSAFNYSKRFLDCCTLLWNTVALKTLVDLYRVAVTTLFLRTPPGKPRRQHVSWCVRLESAHHSVRPEGGVLMARSTDGGSLWCTTNTSLSRDFTLTYFEMLEDSGELEGPIHGLLLLLLFHKACFYFLKSSQVVIPWQHH